MTIINEFVEMRAKWNREDLAQALAERDEARAEVERLRAQVEECNEGVRYWTELARAEAEDAARLRAQVERVRNVAQITPLLGEVPQFDEGYETACDAVLAALEGK